MFVFVLKILLLMRSSFFVDVNQFLFYVVFFDEKQR
jgi:hypothetical protein